MSLLAAIIAFAQRVVATSTNRACGPAGGLNSHGSLSGAA